MYHCVAILAGPVAHTAAVTVGHHLQRISKLTVWSDLKKHTLKFQQYNARPNTVEVIISVLQNQYKGLRSYSVCHSLLISIP